MKPVHISVLAKARTLLNRVVRAMDIHLHLGAHRTATTTFQTYLLDNQKILNYAGITVWAPEHTRHSLFHGLFGAPQKRDVARIRTARRSTGLIKIERQRLALAGTRSLVISEENAVGAMRHNFRAQALYPQARARLLRWRAGLQDGVTRIGFGIRSYESYWASALAFAVLHGQRVPDIAACDRLVAQPRRWRDVIREITGVFPGAELMVWDFDDFANRPHDQLTALTGKITPSARLMLAKGHHRNARVNAADLHRVVEERHGHSHMIPDQDAPWDPFNADQRAAFRAQYAEDLAWLSAGADGIATFKQSKEVACLRQENPQVTRAARREIRIPRPPTGGHYGTERHMV